MSNTGTGYLGYGGTVLQCPKASNGYRCVIGPFSILVPRSHVPIRVPSPHAQRRGHVTCKVASTVSISLYPVLGLDLRLPGTWMNISNIY